MAEIDITTVKQRFGIIGTNPNLHRAIEIAVQVARTDLSVLVTGESGVGKEHFPKIIHNYSARKHGKYFAINCGAIPEGTIDSELFGHEKGAFTDAKAEHQGYFEIADGGTLFLDEVGELPMQTQVRLLRVLETGEFIRMGSNKVQKTNVRVVAATNLDMKKAIEDGRFREDLYYRLNTVEIRVPALRDRREDIPMLFRKFAVDFCNKYQMPPLSLNEEATQLLKNAYWRGNIRQLKNIAEQISVIEMDHQINAETLKRYLPQEEQQHGLVIRTKTQQETKDYSNEIGMLYNMLIQTQKELRELKQQIANSTPIELPSEHSTHTFIQAPTTQDEWEEVEGITEEPNTPIVEDTYSEPIATPTNIKDAQLDLIQRTLKECGGNRKEAASKLGISERTLYRKIKEYGL